jgi:hypothetical protein
MRTARHTDLLELYLLHKFLHHGELRLDLRIRRFHSVHFAQVSNCKLRFKHLEVTLCAPEIHKS